MTPLSNQLSYTPDHHSQQHGSGSGALYNAVDASDPTSSNDPITSTANQVPNKLRRAEYVRVVDLVPNIDMEKLKREMIKIEQQQQQPQPQHEPQKQQQQQPPHSQGPSFSSSLDKKQQHSSSTFVGGVVGEETRDVSNRGGNNSDRSIGMSTGRATEGKPFLQKIVPPSGGFNMCL